MERNAFLKDVVLPTNLSQTNENVKIRVITGPYSGQEFEAIRNKKTIAGKTVNFYHVECNGAKTYFLEKDVIVV
jgi:hypothetical protein